MSSHPVRQVAADQIDDATLAQIEQEMSGDGVWIDPVFARSHDISAADEGAIEAAVAQGDGSNVHVVLVEVSSNDDRFQGSFSSLAAWLNDDLGGDVTYVGWDAWSEPSLSVVAFGDQPSTSSVANVVNHEHPDDITAQVLAVPDLLDAGTAPTQWQEVPQDERYSWTADDDSGLGWWIGGSVGALLLLGAGWWWARRRYRRVRTGFVLPTAVLRTVRAAEDRKLRQHAEAEVLSLGEALGRAEPGGSEESLTAWQQALDHYAAARSVLDRAGSPADIVGVLVLARRGENAREAASRGLTRAWRAPVGCWFNPLHETTTTTVTWRENGRSVDVPACANCAGSVERGEEPDDVLDFIEGDRTVHYFHLDLGAWSRTGYGALEPDLIGALRPGRGGRRGRR